MCRVYNTIGCLNTIQFELFKNSIDEFNSLNDLINFQKNYQINEQKIVSDHNLLVEKERVFLEKEISELNTLIPEKINDLKNELRLTLDNLNQEIENLPETNSKIILVIKDYWVNLIIHIKFWSIQLLLPLKIILFKYRSKKMLSKKNKHLEYISTNFKDAVNESSFEDLRRLKIKKDTIDKLNNTIYGAIGEQKVENQLKKLTDDYILINDFCYTFKTPIHHDNDYIKSIQIDHLLISPSGIFIIETKNWSNDSINNIELRSPVKQILRTNFALFKILANNTSWNFARQHWGNRKIPIKNIIVFINNVPREQFQFIKILGLTELLHYVQYFNPSFTLNETQMISDFLLKLSEHKEITSKLVI